MADEANSSDQQTNIPVTITPSSPPEAPVAETLEPSVASTPAETTPEPPADPVAPSGPAPTAVTSDGPGKKGGKKLLWILLAIIVVLGAGGAAYALTHKSKDKATATATATKQDVPLIRYGTHGADYSTYYPLNVNAEAIAQVDSQLFEGLVRYQGQSKLVPLLATSWANPTTSTWVFTLRQGVKFHSGNTMTPADVKYSLDYAVTHQDDQDGSLTTSLASTIKSVSVSGTDQVTVTTDGPDPTLLNRLAQLYILDSKATVGDPNAGTGPYTVKAGVKPTTDNVAITAFNGYWGGHVYTREVDYASLASTDDLATGTIAGKYDVANSLTSSQLDKVNPPHKVTDTDLGVTFLGLNANKTTSPLHTLAARQAVASAIDVPSVLKAGDYLGQQQSQLIAKEIPGYNSAIKSTPYNVAKAKSLLANVSNLSTPMTLAYYPSSSTGTDGDIIEIVKELDAVGFKVTPVPINDFNTYITGALGGKYDLYYVAYSSDTNDGLDIIDNVVIGNANYTNATVSSLSDKAATTIDPAARLKLLQQIEQQVYNDTAVIPLYSLTNVNAVEKSYHIQIDIPNTGFGVYFWQVYQ